MTEAERERLSRNLAEVTDDLYRQHAPPRDHERLIQLVQVQIRHAMSLAERHARHDRERPRCPIFRTIISASPTCRRSSVSAAASSSALRWLSRPSPGTWL